MRRRVLLVMCVGAVTCAGVAGIVAKIRAQAPPPPIVFDQQAAQRWARRAATELPAALRAERDPREQQRLASQVALVQWLAGDDAGLAATLGEFERRANQSPKLPTRLLGNCTVAFYRWRLGDGAGYARAEAAARNELAAAEPAQVKDLLQLHLATLHAKAGDAKEAEALAAGSTNPVHKGRVYCNLAWFASEAGDRAARERYIHLAEQAAFADRGPGVDLDVDGIIWQAARVRCLAGDFAAQHRAEQPPVARPSGAGRRAVPARRGRG